MAIALHASPSIAWHQPFAKKMKQGLDALGLDSFMTSQQERVSDVAVLLGTSLWRRVEDGDYLLVDRCSFGDTNQWVSLVWNGHGRRGNHMVPERVTSERWDSIGVELKPPQKGRNRVICGQTEPYSPHYSNMEAWYSKWDATHFRKHPQGTNPTRLPETRSWDDCGLAITLNSSIGVETVMNGIETVVDDEGGMAYGIEDREEWCHWLAWTQWHHEEVAAGIPHLWQI